MVGALGIIRMSYCPKSLPRVFYLEKTARSPSPGAVLSSRALVLALAPLSSEQLLAMKAMAMLPSTNGNPPKTDIGFTVIGDTAICFWCQEGPNSF